MNREDVAPADITVFAFDFHLGPVAFTTEQFEFGSVGKTVNQIIVSDGRW